MAVTYKDINQLSQKGTVAGTEKLPVSDTQFITPEQIAALAILGDGVENVVTLTSAEYEALTTKDPDTIYVVTDVSGAVQFVALTMAQYEALATKDPNTLYIVTDVSGSVQFVALTQAQYEALSTKDPNTLYIITDASGS